MRVTTVGYEELTSLSLSYPPAAQEDLINLANGYQRRSEGEILELAAMAADLSTERIVNWGLEPEPDPQVLEALERHYDPNPIPEDLGERSGESLGGLVGAVKGIYFEVLVRDRLIDKETVGELSLEPGQVAQLGATDEIGWDLEIIDRNTGETVEQLQFKAHKYMGGIYKALKEHDFRVVVAEAEDIDSTPDEIIGTNVSLKDLTEYTKEQLSEFAEGTVENAVDVAAEAVETAWDIIPLGSGLLIGVTEGRRYLMGRATLQESIKSGGRRAARSTAYHALGAALSATGLGLAAIPVVMGLRAAETRIIGQVNLADGLTARTAELNQLPGLDG